MKLSRTSSVAGFSMIEIALALAVIAFALIAIVGLLPIGMQVQRDNREETIINQDGTYLLSAITHGAEGIDDLTNYVDYVWTNRVVAPVANGADIIRFLGMVDSTNVAFVRAISGSAAEKGPDLRDFALRYEVTSVIRPVGALGSVETNSFYAGALANSLYDVRLVVRWPVLPNGKMPETPHRQIFRTVVAGTVDASGSLNTGRYR